MAPALRVLCGAAVLLCGSALPVTAQEAAAGARVPIQEHEVRAYTAAKREVQKLAQIWVPKLESAQEDERLALRHQFAAELLGKVRAEGLSMARYSEIQAAEQRDGALRSRIERMPDTGENRAKE